MDLHPTLDDFLDNFLEEELDRLIYQGSKLEASLHFHQVMMEELCYSIKAHDHWVHYEEYFPFSIHCKLCGKTISPEFDRGRHRGRCKLRGILV